MPNTMDVKALLRKEVSVRDAAKIVGNVLGFLFAPCNPFNSPYFIAGQRNSDRRMKQKAAKEQREMAQRNEERAVLREQRDAVNQARADERARMDRAMFAMRAENERLRNEILKEQARKYQR